jgi:hypothetical protein
MGVWGEQGGREKQEHPRRDYPQALRWDDAKARPRRTALVKNPHGGSFLRLRGSRE